MSLSRGDLVRLAADVGLGGFAADIGRLARTSAVIDLDGPSAQAVAASRLGGHPDLPPDVEWPDNFGTPLTFLGQINLDDVPSSIDGRDALPTGGILAFFYDVEEQPWGGEEDHEGSRLIWIHREAALAPRATPDGAQELPGMGVVIREVLSIPEFDSVEMERAFGTTEPPAGGDRRNAPGVVAYGQLRQLVETTQQIGAADRWGSIHRLFGWPDQIQSDVHCENDRWAGSRHGDGPCPHDWRLVLQLDSDEALGTMWGDVGRLYWSIDAASDPELRLWHPPVILQCA